MDILTIGEHTTGHVALDMAAQDGNERKIAIVIAAQLDSATLDELSEDYNKLYWASCPTPAICALMQLRKLHGTLDHARIYVMPEEDQDVSFIFLNGRFTAHMDEAQMRKALAI